MRYDAALAPCGSYDRQEVEEALRLILEKTGGLDFVRPGMRVAVKVNLVAGLKPERAATVHPELVCALTRLLKERGAEVVVGDSPGGLFTASFVGMVYDACGMRRAEEFGAVMNGDFTQETADYPEAVQARCFPFTAYLKKADAVIDVCKLKSHGMMGMSCAVKNMFGAIPGTVKPEFHYKYPRAEDFADMLVDVYEYIKPRLCICDGVIAMEGNGPTQGTPRKTGVLLASADGHLLDRLCAELIALKPEDVPTLSAAARRGLLPEEPDRDRIFGDPAKYAVPDFETAPAQSTVGFHLLGAGPAGRLADRVVTGILSPFPKLRSGECVGCGKCASICPAKAITMKNKKPRIDRSVCIRCFCCQEFCPVGAMKIGRRAIVRLLGK